jgi:hypothetical protein
MWTAYMSRAGSRLCKALSNDTDEALIKIKKKGRIINKQKFLF